MLRKRKLINFYIFFLSSAVEFLLEPVWMMLGGKRGKNDSRVDSVFRCIQ